MVMVVAELNQQKPNPQTFDSVSRDNPSGDDQKDSPLARRSCNHFSIRGYVAELRKRDPKLCDPFSALRSPPDGPNSSSPLPPMVVPKFRWWKCDGCVPNSSDITPTETTKSPHNNSPQPSNHLTVKQQEPNSKAGEQNAHHSNAKPSCSLLATDVADDPKGKRKVHVEDELIVLPTGCKENGIVESLQKKSTLDGIEKGASKDCMGGENGKAGSVSSLPDLNEGDKNATLESGDVNVCEDEDDYLGVRHRKVRKVRLLSELLGTKETQNHNVKLKTTKPAYSEASDSESEDDKPTEMVISEDLVKKRSNKSTPAEKPLLEKRNNKKIKTDDQVGCSSTKIPSKSSKEKPSQDVLADLVADPLRKGDGSLELSEKRPGLAKRKGKMVQVGKDRTCLKECSPFRKDDKETSTQKGAKNVQNEPSNGPVLIDYNAVRKQTVNPCIRDSSVGFTVQNSQAEEGKSSPLVQHNVMQVSGSIINQKEPSRRMQDIDINSIPTDDKDPEEAKGDDSHDIPMDIVELMAKNQYERNLGDQRDKHHCVASVPENVRSDGSSSACGQQLPKLMNPHFLSWQSPLFSKDPRSNVTNGFEAMNINNNNNNSKPQYNAANARFEAMNSPFSKFNQSHLSFTGHISKTQVSDKPYSAFDFSAKNWTGHKEAPQRCTPSFLSTMGSYRPHIEPRGWPSGGMAKSHHQGPSVLNFSAVNHLEKQINFSNTFAGAGSHKRGASSSDLYSNEAIPAMHLLSLMQSAGKSDQLKKPPSVPTVHPTVSSFASLPFQSDAGSIGRRTSFPTQIPLTSHGQRNIGSPHFASLRPPILPVSASNIGRKRQLDSGLYKGKKGKFGMPNLPHSDLPLQGRNSIGSCPHIHGLDKKTNRPIPQEGVCVLNQNPSEFNDLKELRKYMIRPEDLRPRERRVQQGNGKRQEMRMDKHVPCANSAIRKLATQVSPM